MFFWRLLGWLIDKLPDFIINESLWGHVIVALEWVSWANYYLPIPTFLLIIGMYMTVYMARAVLKIFTAGQF